jgi:hypothetical protein
MGVRTSFTDYFQRAKNTEATWKLCNASSSKKIREAPRVDMEMQTLVEI